MRLTTLALSLMLVICCNHAAASEPASNAEKAPDWTLASADGSQVTLSSEVAEQPVVLFFWATWCPYCKALMPKLQEIRLQHGENVKILALHFRDDDGDPVAFMQEAGYDFTVIPDADDVAHRYDVWGTPGVMIVDHDMRIRFNLYDLPRLEETDSGKATSRKTKAASRAPYWAAEIRRTLQVVLKESTE